MACPLFYSSYVCGWKPLLSMLLESPYGWGGMFQDANLKPYFALLRVIWKVLMLVYRSVLPLLNQMF